MSSMNRSDALGNPRTGGVVRVVFRSSKAWRCSSDQVHLALVLVSAYRHALRPCDSWALARTSLR